MSETDDFEEIVGTSVGRIASPCVFSVSDGGAKRPGRKCTFTFWLDLCDADVADFLATDTRFNIAFSPTQRRFRFTQNDAGVWCMREGPRNKRVVNVSVRFPERGLKPPALRLPVDLAMNDAADALFIEMPRDLWID